MTITTGETDISGVVSDYIAVQDLCTGKILGSGRNGTVSFQTGNSTIPGLVLNFFDIGPAAE
jgi:hypothetical protein